MAKFFTVLLILVGNLVFANGSLTPNNSSFAYIIFALIALLAIVYVLYRKQKRRFND